MTINVSPADRGLTEHFAIFNRAAERALIQRERVAYQRRGGMVASYEEGATWEHPSHVRTMIGRKTVRVDVSDYVKLISARLEEKRQRARRLHDERLIRAQALLAESRVNDADKVWEESDYAVA